MQLYSLNLPYFQVLEVIEILQGLELKVVWSSLDLDTFLDNHGDSTSFNSPLKEAVLIIPYGLFHGLEDPWVRLGLNSVAALAGILVGDYFPLVASGRQMNWDLPQPIENWSLKRDKELLIILRDGQSLCSVVSLVSDFQKSYDRWDWVIWDFQRDYFLLASLERPFSVLSLGRKTRREENYNTWYGWISFFEKLSWFQGFYTWAPAPSEMPLPLEKREDQKKLKKPEQKRQRYRKLLDCAQRLFTKVLGAFFLEKKSQKTARNRNQ
jgi:hypothetical protein